MSSINSFYTPTTFARSTTLGQNMRLRDSIAQLSDRIATLTEQQTSGLWATTHGELRSQSTLVQGLRQKMTTIDGYLRTLGQVQTRIEGQQGAADVLQKAVDKLGINGMVALNSDAEVQLQQIPREAFGTLESVISSLNTNIEGRYLFSGADTQTRPVADLNTILNGSAGKMGLKDAAAARLLADLGGPIDSPTTNPTGRVNVSRTGDQVSVVHDGGPFGLKLRSASFPSPNVAPVAPSTGVVPTASGSRLDFDIGSVAPNDIMIMTFELPTGETLDITMKAVTTKSAIPVDGVVEFEVDGTGAMTGANFVNALQDRITEIARTDLAGASGMAAANDFFDFYPPRLVAGSDPATATGFDISSAKAIEWYDGPQGPRPTADTTVNGTYSGVATGDGVTGAPTPAQIGQRYFVNAAGNGWGALDVGSYATWDGAGWSFGAGPAVNDRIIGGADFPAAQQGQVLQWDGAAWNVAVPADPANTRYVSGAGGLPGDVGKVLQYNPGTTSWEPVSPQPSSVLDVSTSNARVGSFDGFSWSWTTPEAGYEMVVGSGNDATLYKVASGTWTNIGAPVEQPANARDTVSAKIDDGTWVSYGARANEDAFRNALKGAAILAAVPHDADNPGHYHALTSRAAPLLKSTAAEVVDVRTAIGVTQDRLQVTQDRHEDVRSLTEQQTLRIEKIDPYRVATELNNLMTQLQGTYSIAAKVQQLSLVNFL